MNEPSEPPENGSAPKAMGWREPVAFYLLITAALLVSHASTLDLPMFHDDAIFFGRVVRHLYEARLNFIADPDWLELYHPPLLSLWLAGLSLLFGWSIKVLHVGIILAAALLPLGIFRLLRAKLAVIPAAALAVAFCCSPLFTWVSTSFAPDLPAAGFALLAFDALLARRQNAAGIFLALAGLTNGMTFVVAPALAWLAGRLERERRGSGVRGILIFLMPSVVALGAWSLWFIVRFGGFGDLLGEPTNHPMLLTHPADFAKKLFVEYPKIVAAVDGRIVMLALALAGFGARIDSCRRSKRRLLSSVEAAAGAAVAVQLVFLSAFPITNSRYCALSTAFLFVGAGWLALSWPVGRRRIEATVITISVVVGAWGIYDWFYGQPVIWNESVFIVRSIRAVQALAAKLEADTRNPIIYSPWPWNFAFSGPITGMSTRPIDAVLVDTMPGPPFDFPRGRPLYLLALKTGAAPQIWSGETLKALRGLATTKCLEGAFEGVTVRACELKGLEF